MFLYIVMLLWLSMKWCALCIIRLIELFFGWINNWKYVILILMLVYILWHVFPP